MISEAQYHQVINSPSSISSDASNNKTNRNSSRYTGKIKALDGIWLELRNAQLDSLDDLRDKALTNGGSGGGLVSCLPSRESSSILGKGNGFRIDCTQLGPIHRKSHQRIISIKNLFSNAPKFSKNFQRGVFLSCLIYCEDKILVTLDDILPTFQIDEDLSSSFQHDFYWMHKISTIWSDTKFLKQEMEKCDSASTFHFRLKILQAIVTMQESLDLRDLGKVFYKPITTENNNITFIATVSHLRSTKLVSAPNLKWITLEKFKARKMHSEAYHALSSSAQILMIYHQMCNIPLGKGLYLGYFKLVTSVDQLKLIVPEKTPSIIPHVKIRNNPHITGLEWELLSTFLPEGESQSNLSESQQMFKQQVDSSLKKLFSNLKIDRTSALNHRFYTTEVIEVSSSVSFIIVLPQQEDSCLIEGDAKEVKWMEENKFITLPVQVFEMVHTLTYHNTLARRFMRLSSTLEVESVLAQHNRRKAFDSSELSLAQHQLSTLTEIQSKLDQTWKDCRWIMEVVKACRAKDKIFMTLRDFLSRYNTVSPNSSTVSSPNKKFPNRGTYVNGAPFSRLQLQQLLNLRRIQQQHQTEHKDLIKPSLTSSDLPGPCIPSNPNFKYESSSSLPIVSNSKSSAKNLDKLRSSASLFDMSLKLGNGAAKTLSNSSSCSNSNSNSVDLLLMNIEQQFEYEQNHVYQNIQDIHEDEESEELCPTYQNVNPLPNYTVSPTISKMHMAQELDAYMRHTSSLSKLVNLNKKVDVRSSSLSSSCVPGTSDPSGLQSLSWTKQRTSLDRCFGLNPVNVNFKSSESEDDLENSDVKNTSAFGIFEKSKKVVEIYAAYDCGLSTGTCVRFAINQETSARQIIQQLISKLDEEVKGKNGTVVHAFCIDDFCLVSVIGARERVLRMDYKPLRLQKPWDSARLFVRKKQDVTSAVSLEATIITTARTTNSDFS